jgi:plasmid replication initiation protein
LGVPSNKLKSWHNFKNHALDLAVAEVNQLAGFTVAYRPIKRGHRITGTELAWGKKEQAELILAQRELDRPRVGRTARRCR